MKDLCPPSPSTVGKYHHAPVEIPHLPAADDSADSPVSSLNSMNRESIDESVSNYDFSSSSGKISHPTRTLYYPSLDKCTSLESDLQVQLPCSSFLQQLKKKKKLTVRLPQDFVSSLFWVLESKRLFALSNIDKEKQPLLCAPFERKDLIGTSDS